MPIVFGRRLFDFVGTIQRVSELASDSALHRDAIQQRIQGVIQWNVNRGRREIKTSNVDSLEPEEWP